MLSLLESSVATSLAPSNTLTKMSVPFFSILVLSDKLHDDTEDDDDDDEAADNTGI